jgi:hypothetical protein
MALADRDTDSTMAADWREISARYAPEDDGETIATDEAAPADESPAEGAAPAEDKAAKLAADKGEPEKIAVARDRDGKFKPKPKEAPAAAKGATPAADQTATSAATGTDAPAAGADNALQRDIARPPSTWKPAARAEWDKLTPAIRAEIHRREADFQQGQAQLLPDARLGADIRSTIEPYRMMIEAEGGTPVRAVADLLRTAAIFRVGTEQQKYQAVAQIARQFGIDLRRFAQATGTPAPAGTAPPQPLRDPRVDQLLAREQQAEQRRTAAEQAQVEAATTRWINELDASGNPKREYLGDVMQEMMALVPQIRQADPSLSHSQVLDAAYDRATWAHPEVRTLLAQKQQAELEAQRRAENQSRVRDARRAGSVNVPRRASVPAPVKPGRMEDTIADTARALGLIST